jgi:mutator protein MutT
VTGNTERTHTDAHRTDVVIGIVARTGKVLICQRPEDKSFGGCWEFPGGKREPGETVEQCLRRELREELAIGVTPLRALTTLDHDYPRGKIRLHPYVCALAEGEPQWLACQEARWVEPRELVNYPFPPPTTGSLPKSSGSCRPRRPPPPIDFCAAASYIECAGD